MLVIRLSRTGRKKQPNYRVVVAEKSAPIKGRFIEILGHYNPRTKALEINVERAKAVVANGAQPSETAEALLEKAGVLQRQPITDTNRRPTREKRTQADAEAAAPAAPKDAPAAEASSSESAPDASEPTDSAATAKEDTPDVETAAPPADTSAPADPAADDQPPADAPKTEAAADSTPETSASEDAASAGADSTTESDNTADAATQSTDTNTKPN